MPQFFPAAVWTLAWQIAHGLLVPIHLPSIQIPGGPQVPIVHYVEINSIRIWAGDRPDDPDLLPLALYETREGDCTRTLIRVGNQNRAVLDCPVGVK